MSKEASALVQRLWNYCNLLRDDGLSYGDYVEQLTYLLFLKMSHEQSLPPNNKPSPIPEEYSWQSLLEKKNGALDQHYRTVLEKLGEQQGMLGLIFNKATNKIQDPAKLQHLIHELINREQWNSLTNDVKGDAYEGLLERNAQDTKSGAGQYFTTRSVVQAIVEVIRPQLGETICDPACGTGGFLLESHRFIEKHNPKQSKKQKQHLRLKALRGVELVASVTRLCAMNLLLHAIGPVNEDETELPVKTANSLSEKSVQTFDIVLTNPPFGKKSSITITSDEDEDDKNGLTVVRDGDWISTNNKQLNFVQHVTSLLSKTGRAAVVIPDNVLFEGGAGESIRRKLLEECDVHTLLRLPTGIFYAQGVKANVLFFERKQKGNTNKKLWIYDLRTNLHFTLRTNPLKSSDLDEFVDCYKANDHKLRKATWSESNQNGRWRAYSYDEILQRDKLSLDIFWLRDESLEAMGNGTSLEVLAAEIIVDLRSALAGFEELQNDLSKPKKKKRLNSFAALGA